MIALQIALLAMVDAIGWRLRGTAWWAEATGTGATTARILGGLLVAGACWLLGLLDVAPAVWLAAALWLGATVPWWGSLDMSGPGDVARHSLAGLLRVLPAALLLWWIGGAWWPLLAAGALCGPVYWAAGTTDRAEPAWGAVRGAAIAGGLAWGG